MLRLSHLAILTEMHIYSHLYPKQPLCLCGAPLRSYETIKISTVKLHILERPFIVASPRHTCAIITLSNQHLDMPHL